MTPTLILRDGNTGQLVRDSQRVLGVTADGIYGPATLAAVQAYQRAHSLAPDGAAGPLTLRAMGIMPGTMVDLSHWQGSVDFAALAPAVDLIAIKLTQGASGIDPRGATNLAGARATGKPTLAYHFADLSDLSPQSAVTQALNLVSTTGRGVDLVLDVEDAGVPAGATIGEVCAWTAKCLSVMRDEAGVTPWLYTGHAFLQQRFGGGNAELAQYPLWVARYNGGCDPGPIGAWSRWKAWQWTDSGTLPGVSGHVDLSWVAADEPGVA